MKPWHSVALFVGITLIFTGTFMTCSPSREEAGPDPSPETVSLRCLNVCDRSHAELAEIKYRYRNDQLDYECVCVSDHYLVDSE